MRIYGGHDYYDCVLGYGADPTVVMVRKNEEIDPLTVHIPKPLRVSISEPMPGLRYAHDRGDVKHVCVVFGPKIYYGLEVGSTGHGD